MEVLRDRTVLQRIITVLGNNGKLKRPTSEVIALPNWMLREVIKLRK